MRRLACLNKAPAGAAVVGSFLVLVASAGTAFAFGVSRAGASSAPLSDSGSANCASDGGTLIGSVCRLANGRLHHQYEALIASSGGSGPTPFLFKVVAGSIPPGLQVPPDYAIGEHGTIIGGTPTTRGTYSFTIQVTDGAGDAASGQFNLKIVK
jgi:hypothetical protein